jgi:polysaccharide biosynthesis protein PelC
MPFVRHWITALVLLICLTDPLHAGTDLAAVLRDSARVVVLPLADLADAPEILPSLNQQWHQALRQKRLAMADSSAVAGVLRKYRIRNTTELTSRQLQVLQTDLQADFVLISSLDYWNKTDDAAELALSARLLSLSERRIVWTADATVHGDDTGMPLNLGRTSNLKRIMSRAVSDLMRTFRLEKPRRARTVAGLKIEQHGETVVLPCRTIAVVPFANESSVPSASGWVTSQCVNALMRIGFTVIDPGQLRETIISAGEFTQGEISSAAMAKCLADLNVDVIVTGTVDRFASLRTAELGDNPVVGLQARLVRTSDGCVIWSRNSEREGRDSEWLFGFGGLHGVSRLAQNVSADLMRSLPVVREIPSISAQGSVHAH